MMFFILKLQLCRIILMEELARITGITPVKPPTVNKNIKEKKIVGEFIKLQIFKELLT